MSDLLVIALDDEPGTVQPLAGKGIKLVVVAPADVQSHADDFKNARLILLDHELGDTTTNELSMTVRDGTGFVSHLRSWARRGAISLPPIALLTNKPEAFARELPAVGPAMPLGDFRGKEHRIAPRLDVEWLLFKNDNSVAEKIAAIATDYESASGFIGSGGASIDEIKRALSLSDDQPWSKSASEDIQRAGAPVSGAENSATKLLRWLYQTCFPYPGLFLSDLHVAWSLGMELEAFKEVATWDATTPWLKNLHAARYTGCGRTLYDRRWWRAGIDIAAYDLTQEAASQGSRDTAFKKLVPGAPIALRTTAGADVVIWDSELREVGIVPIEKATQLHPPGWPADALSPWIATEQLAGDPVLSAMAEPLDA